MKQDILAESAFVDGDKSKLDTLDKINAIADKATAYALTGVVAGTVYKTTDTGILMEYLGGGESTTTNWLETTGFTTADKAKLGLTPQKLAGSAVMTSLETGTVSITLRSTTGYMAVIWGNGVGEVKGAGVAGQSQAFSSTTGAGEIHCFSSDASGNPSGDLTTLYCHNNNLTSLDVSGLTALTYLQCFTNNLTSLDVSGLTALIYLHCGYNNNLTSLDVSGLTALTNLQCGYNNLTSLDVSGLTALTTLYADSNNLTSLLATGVDLSFEYYGSGSYIAYNNLSEAALIAFVDSLATTTTGVIGYGSNTGSAAFETWLTNNPTLDKGYIWRNN